MPRVVAMIIMHWCSTPSSSLFNSDSLICPVSFTNQQKLGHDPLVDSRPTFLRTAGLTLPPKLLCSTRSFIWICFENLPMPLSYRSNRTESYTAWARWLQCLCKTTIILPICRLATTSTDSNSCVFQASQLKGCQLINWPSGKASHMYRFQVCSNWETHTYLSGLIGQQLRHTSHLTFYENKSKIGMSTLP